MTNFTGVSLDYDQLSSASLGELSLSPRGSNG